MTNTVPGGGGDTSSDDTTRRRRRKRRRQSNYSPSSGGTLNFAELIALAERAGFSRSQAVVMAAIAKAESGGQVGIDNAGLNKDGSVDYGLWQINSSHGFDPQRLTTDPLYNAKAAFKVFSGQGLDAWVTYSNGSYQQYLDHARQAAGNVSEVDLKQVLGRDYQSAAGAGGAPAGDAEFSKGDLRGMLDDLGLPKALIEQHASLKKAFQEIVSKQITDESRIAAIFKGTKWWQDHSAAQRQFATLKYDDPAEFRRQLDQQRDDIHTLSQQLGVQLDSHQLDRLAHISLRNGFDSQELQRAIAHRLDYEKGDALKGQAGVDLAGLQKLAADYGVRVGHGQLEDMLQRMIANNLTPEAMVEYFKQQALSSFPHLEKQIKSGFTVADIADPYRRAMAQLLEIDPNGITTRDNTIMKALQMQDGKGGFQLMPEWQFEQMLRQDKRWLKTNNARESLLDVGHTLLRNFGLAV